MGVDYVARKAAKKQRKAGVRSSEKKGGRSRASFDGDGGADKKGKRDRPKRGRKGARRMCKGMCYGAAPVLNDDDLEWSPDDHVAPQIVVPRPTAAVMAGAAAGAATLRSVAASAAGEAGGGGGAASRKKKKGGGAGGGVPAPPSPDPAPPATRRFSTGVGSLAVKQGGPGAAAAAAGTRPKATTLDAARAGALAAGLPQTFIALAVAGGAWPPTAVQAGTWAAAAGGRDVLAVAPPGAGKTLAYAVPAAAAAVGAVGAREPAPPKPKRPATPTSVVLVPARELGAQVAAAFTTLRRGRGAGAAARVALVVGGTDRGAQAAAAAGASIIVATPGRLLDLVDAGDVDLGHTAVVAVDEADKLLSPGLAPQMDRLRDLLLGSSNGGGRTVILASATMPAAVDAAADAWLAADRRTDVVVTGLGKGDADDADDAAAAPPPSTTVSRSITQAVHVCAAHKKTAKLLKHVAAVNAAAAAAGARHRPRVAVFVNRIATAKEVAAALTGAGHKVALLHGARPQAERDAALAAFRAGSSSILVATDVAARGLHIPALRHVVNYDFPPSLDVYTHRVGRAGRLEDGGHAFSFFTRPLAPLARPLLRLLDAAGAPVDPNLARLADAYDEARAKVAALPEVEGGDEKAARKAAIGRVLADGGGGDKKKAKKKKKVVVVVDEDAGPASDDDSDGPPAHGSKPSLTKADLPGLYKSRKRPASGGGGEGVGGASDSDSDGPPAWTVVEGAATAAPAAVTTKRRKALPGRLRKKQKQQQQAKKNATH